MQENFGLIFRSLLLGFNRSPILALTHAAAQGGGEYSLGEACLLTVGAFLLTLKLLCLQSLKALIRRTFPP